MKPRTVSGMVALIAKEDPCFADLRVTRRSDATVFSVFLTSAVAKVKLQEDIEYPLVRNKRVDDEYLLEWDISSMKTKAKRTGVSFYCCEETHRDVRKAVTKQEDRAAETIGGRRHIGSGAIPDIKSDASSREWQLEAKMTERKSISLSIEWLKKITYEASVVGKRPMMYLTFSAIPDGVRMEDTWVVIPESAFKRMSSEPK